MAYAHVQGTTHSGQSGTSVTVTLGSAVTSGNTVTGVVGWVGDSGGTDGVTLVTDDKGNVYQGGGFIYNSAGGNNYYWYTFRLVNITNGPTTITATIGASGSPSFVVVMADEWSGIPTNSVMTSSATDGATGGTSITSSAMLSSQSGNFSVGYIVSITSSGLTAGQTSVQNVSSTWLSEWTTSSGGTQAMTATAGSNGDWSAVGFSLGAERAANNFYVSSSGNDSNNGTSPSTPWLTISHVNSQAFASGDTINFNGGNTFAGGLIISPTNYSGAQGSSPLVIQSYGTGQATISPTGADGVYFNNIGNCTVSNLILTGDNSANFNGVNYLQDGSTGTFSGVTVSTLTISNFGRSGVFFSVANTVNSLQNVTISSCSVSGCTGNISVTDSITAGITLGTIGSIGNRSFIGGTFTSTLAINTVTVTGCSVESCLGTAAVPSPYQSSTGIFVGNATNALTTLCYVANNGANDSQGNAGIEYNWCTNSTISFCEVFNQTVGTATSDGDGIDFDTGCQNCVAEYNYIHHCVGAGIFFFNFGGMTHTGCVARFNILENNASKFLADITVGSDTTLSPTNIEIYNNTIFADATHGSFHINISASGSNTTTGYFLNNIVYAGTAFIQVSLAFVHQSMTINGNQYYNAAGGFNADFNGTTYTSFASYKSGSSQDANSVVTNPLLLNAGSGGTIGGYSPPNPTAYHLQRGSPAIGTGLNINSLFSINPGPHDFYGNPIPNGVGNGYNIGADAGLGNLGGQVSLTVIIG